MSLKPFSEIDKYKALQAACLVVAIIVTMLTVCLLTVLWSFNICFSFGANLNTRKKDSFTCCYKIQDILINSKTVRIKQLQQLVSDAFRHI
jgi:hypothetical protein